MSNLRFLYNAGFSMYLYKIKVLVSLESELINSFISWTFVWTVIPTPLFVFSPGFRIHMFFRLLILCAFWSFSSCSSFVYNKTCFSLFLMSSSFMVSCFLYYSFWTRCSSIIISWLGSSSDFLSPEVSLSIDAWISFSSEIVYLRLERSLFSSRAAVDLSDSIS